MHKKKKHTNAAAAAAAQPESQTEKLALVKAAAWAWHQHSSSSISKQSPEFPSISASRRRSAHRPSRYQLESLSKSDHPTASPVSLVSEKTGPITLLDLYEIERITRELERLVAASERREKVQGKKEQIRKNTGRGCLFRKHAVTICGSDDTAADTEALVGRRRERSTY